VESRTVRTLSIASIAVGVLFYVLGVSGALWPATPPTDVGLATVSILAVLFGAVGFLFPTRA